MYIEDDNDRGATSFGKRGFNPKSQLNRVDNNFINPESYNGENRITILDFRQSLVSPFHGSFVPVSTIPGSLQQIDFCVLLLLIDLKYFIGTVLELKIKNKYKKGSSSYRKDEKPVVPP